MKTAGPFLMLIALFAYPLFSQAGTCYVKSWEKACEADGKTYKRGDDIKNCIPSAIARQCDAILCFSDVRGRPVCSACKESECAPPETSSQSIGATLLALLSAKPNIRYGGKRLQEAAPRVEGLPYEEVLMPKTALMFSPVDPDARVEKFALFADGGSAIALPGIANNTVTVSAKALSPGKTYRWSARVKGQSYKGEFSTLEVADQAEFDAELTASWSQSDDTLSSRQFVRAVLAREYGYTFDMYQSLKAARTALH